jgi:hypothetical protein
MFHFSTFFASVGMFFSGMFGGHASMPSMTPPANGSHWEATTTGGMHMGANGMMAMRNGVFGTVTAVDGDTITVLGRQGTTTASTTYSVDASNAKVIKGSATTTASVSDISVGDRVIVQGTVTGASIAATTIIDGRVMMMGAPGMRGPRGATSTPGMRHPTPGTPPGFNPGGPMIPAGQGGASANANVNVNVGGY